MYLQIIFLLNI